MRARKAVITAAGRGTRQFPATRSIQKELLPLVDADGLTKPTIQIIAEQCIQAGIEEICIVVERGGEGPFRNHFRAFTPDEQQVFANKPWAMEAGAVIADLAERIAYVEQPAPEGFGHAVFQARDWVGDEPFLLLLGDHVYTAPTGSPSPIVQILDAAQTSGGSITGVRLEPRATVDVTGIIRGTPTREGIATDAPGQVFVIEDLQEKPSRDEVMRLVTPGLPPDMFLGHYGLHLFTPDIFGALGHLIETGTRVKNEIQLTSGQEVLLRRSRTGGTPPYQAALLGGTRWDTGMPDVYLETLLAFAQRGPFAAHLSEAFGLAPPQG